MHPSIITRQSVAASLTIASIALLSGCGGSTGGTMTVAFPDPQTLQFEAKLSQESSFALDGQILLPPYGDIYFLPANAQRGFTWGGRLDLEAFLPESWEFAEVTQLPTGAFFPPYIRSALVQVPLSEDFDAYLGVREQKALGIAWSFLKSDDTAIGIGANYYDAQGNIVMGGLFYPPRKQDGVVTVPGGLFIATDLTPFLPASSSQPLKMRPYAVENGRVREFTRKDMKIAEHYLAEFEAARRRAGSIRLSSPPDEAAQPR